MISYFRFTKVWGFILITTLSFSCEENIDWEFMPEDNLHLAITGIITNENKIQKIEIYQSFNTPSDSSLGITNAEVRLYTIDNSVDFLHDDSNPGTYLSSIAFAGPMNKTIRMEVIHEGQVYEASAEMGAVQPIPPIEISINPITSRRFISKIASLFSPIEQAMYQVQLDWSNIQPDTLNKALLFAYTFNTVDISGIIPPNVEPVNFPAGTLLVEKKFGLTDDYADFLRSLAIQTNWQGGLFDETPGSLESNISNNALGYFSACQVLTDTIIVQ